MKYVFAGDRQISCDILEFLIDKGFKPEALLVSKGKNATHSQQLINISGLSLDNIIYGSEFKSEKNIKKLIDLDVDYIFGIHFPYIIPNIVLEIPKIGFLNLHPAYLPFNKGWHTPSWAIIEEKPYGATLHFMSEALDKGDIIHQKIIEIELDDTANSLYQKVLKLEFEVFKEAFEDLKSLNPKRVRQIEDGTEHSKKNLDDVRELSLDDIKSVGSILDKLRALTTNNVSELAYFHKENKKIGVKVSFVDLTE